MLGRISAAVAACALLAACAPTAQVTSGAAVRPESESAPTTAPTDAPTPPDGSDGAPGEGSLPGQPPPYDPGPIAWTEIDDGLDSATVTVPVDYADPTGATIDLRVVRYRALDDDDRIGSLLVNPGGPGAGGADLARYAVYQFDRPLLQHFDIVGWDPRGAENSEPAIDCIDDADYDRMFAEPDLTPDSPDEAAQIVALAEEFAEGCAANSHGILEFVGTNNSARDMDSIRRALGEETISYFGFSAGSELGATWATLFPATVRAAVLDGASDPDADAVESSLQQSRGFEQSVMAFLDWCDAEGCAFAPAGSADAAYLDLMDSLDAEPVPSTAGRPDVNRTVAVQAVVQAMYAEQYWRALDQSLAAARMGDGSGLLALYDAYYRRGFDGTYGNLLEAFQAISCADTAERRSVEEDDALAPLFEEAAPHLTPPGSVGSYFCTFFPPARDPRVPISAAGAGPIVVIGTTGDPATPFESTVAMAEALEDGRLIEVDANQHLGYPTGDPCVLDAVNDYLVDLVPPPDGLVCD